MAKTNYDAINFKNKDIDKFATKFGEKKDPLKQANITSASESTNVKTQSFVRPSLEEQKNMREQIKKDEQERVNRNKSAGPVG